MKILVLGAGGMVGRAAVRAFGEDGHDVIGLARRDCDARESAAVLAAVARAAPDAAVLAAAHVGGIGANVADPQTFLVENLAIGLGTIPALAGRVARILVLGSSCLYPVGATEPIAEEALGAGPLEPTNRAYAAAKIATIALAHAHQGQGDSRFVCVMPCNIYGPHDRYDPARSHVFAAFIRRFVEAEERGTPEVVLWGTGLPRREFLHVHDLARALVLLATTPEPPFVVNVGPGSGQDMTIDELAQRVSQAVGYTGTIRWDPRRPDGIQSKALDTRRIRSLGWTPHVTLDAGLRDAIACYRRERLPLLPRVM